jgi:hypothetical protein
MPPSSTQKNYDQELIMEKSLLEQIETCANIFSKVSIPLVLLILGLCLNSSYRERELRQQYVEIAVAILGSQPTPETLPLRTWAMRTVNNHAEIKMSPQVREILKGRALPIPHETEDTTGTVSKKDVESPK